MPMNETQLIDALSVMDAGVFLEKFRAALSDTALNTAVYGDKGRAGKVTIELKIERQGQTQAVNVTHKLTFSKPTSKGKVTEETAEMTPFYVKKGGVLSFVSDDETADMFASKEAD